MNVQVTKTSVFSEISCNKPNLSLPFEKTRGDDIDAACGQLAGQVQDKTRRQQKWQQILIGQQG